MLRLIKRFYFKDNFDSGLIELFYCLILAKVGFGFIMYR